MSEALIQLPRLHPGQKALDEHPSRFVVLECGRRFGKTAYGQDKIIRRSLEGKLTGWFAPTYKYLDPAWDAVCSAVKPAAQKIDQQRRLITFPNGGSMEFWSLDNNPDAGRSRKYHFVVVDECGIIPKLEEFWNAALRLTLSDYKGHALFLGTPKGRKFFHTLYSYEESGRKGWKSWRKSTRDNPYIPEEEIKELELTLPPDVYNQEVNGIPADNGGNPFDLQAIRACTAVMSSSPPVCFGIDLAKSADWTVVLGLDEHGRTCHLDRWQGPWEMTMRRIPQIVKDVPTLMDSSGVGDPIVETLATKYPNIAGFKFSKPSKQMLMLELAAAIQQWLVFFPEGWLLNELESFEYDYTPNGGVTYAAPQGMTDDGVMALALAVRHMRVGVVRSRFAYSIIETTQDFGYDD